MSTEKAKECRVLIDSLLDLAREGKLKYEADAAAVAITTTDLVSKSVAIQSLLYKTLAISFGGTDIRIGGMAKGSGMIHPNMATMLGVVDTVEEAVNYILKRELISWLKIDPVLILGYALISVQMEILIMRATILAIATGQVQRSGFRANKFTTICLRKLRPPQCRCSTMEVGMESCPLFSN
ncbi:hypothetical protein Pyn_29169 [Prunus yedoensis var. nudiflora]|uniref:Uncharacterized protein n=1 Tax=Prunus yedoensis var. nudiflora TaxID=2094558 RepID=A0A314UJZ7_PRUYE|nr:hypothetical protein Pyn_29169 [Prunus yedoensis var. nudiflora]